MSNTAPKVRVKLPPAGTKASSLICKCCKGNCHSCQCSGCQVCLNIPCSC